MVLRLEHLLNNKKLNTMKKTNILYTALVILLVASLASCKKDYKAGGTNVQALANEWWVTVDGGTDYYNLTTYNTAANDGKQMWIDDFNNAASFWDIKGKVNVDVANQTFSGTDIANQYYTSTFTITNGKIFTNATKAPGSHDVTDSIRFTIQFSDDDPANTPHVISGYARTKFPEDDH